MAIGMAQQKGDYVYVYDEKNRQIWNQLGQLHGYTSSTVTIRRGDYLYTYNEKGNSTGNHHV